MTKLSVNVNKIATLRNARGGGAPNLVQCVMDIQGYGAEGITVHPRPDERHIKYSDVRDLQGVVNTEFNIEGYPTDDWLKLVCQVKPTQATLVPDAPDAITSNAGWDTIKHHDFLSSVIERLKSNGIRTSIFTGTDLSQIKGAIDCGADRVELYTEPYAQSFEGNKEAVVMDFSKASIYAHSLGLGVNAGHDLNLENLAFFKNSLDVLDEVSIGHALISDALYFGLENTIQMYLAKLV